MSLGAELLAFFINTVLITALLSAYALWRYRVAVLAGMQEVSGAALALPPPPLRMPERAQADSVAELLASERRVHARVMRCYLVAIGVAALPLAWLYALHTDVPRTPAHVALIAGTMLFAAVPMIAVSLAWPWQRGLRFALLLFICASLGTTALSMLQRPFAGRWPSADQLMNIWVFAEFATVLLAPFVALVMLSGNNTLRGVAPISFAALIVFGAAPLLGIHAMLLLGATQLGSRLMLASVDKLGLHLGFLLLALPVGWIAWRRLHAVARAYTAKRFSDAELLARAWWLMFIATTAFELINAGSNIAATVAVSAGSYAAFPLLAGWMFKRSGVAAGSARPRTLLLLRVFGYTARTERLFSRIGSRWRRFGPVATIAAPDVLTRTIDPADYLGWLTGRVDASFVRSQADLDRRLAARDLVPDPDGRYRIDEFCCNDTTWRSTVVALMGIADAIIMDLRGLKTSRGGCEFELRQLAARVDPARLVLVVDAATDGATITRYLGERDGDVRRITIDRGTTRETEALFETLLAAAR